MVIWQYVSSITIFICFLIILVLLSKKSKTTKIVFKSLSFPFKVLGIVLIAFFCFGIPIVIMYKDYKLLLLIISTILFMPWVIKKSYKDLSLEEKKENYSDLISKQDMNNENSNIDKLNDVQVVNKQNDINNK